MTKTQGRVAVVNSAHTVLKPAWSDRQHIDLISDAISRTLKGTGIRFEDIDFVIDSGSDFLDGRSISNCGFLGALGGHHKEESRVEEDGLWSVCYAANKITSEAASVGLVVAYSKSSEGSVDDYWSDLLEPFIQRPVGLDQFSAAGFYAQRYLAAAGLNVDELRVVSSSSWKAAAANPGVDTEGVLDDEAYWNEEVATPLRRCDLARPVDGAAAVLLTRAEVADQITPRPVWLTGFGSAIDQHYLAAREPDSLPALEAAARQAYQAAGGVRPDSFDISEVSADSSVGQLMVLEALGLAEKYHGIDLYRDDANASINPSGGALPADPIMATGLIRLHEAAVRLCGRRSYRTRGARTALVHGVDGFAMQNHCVVTLEVDE